LKWKPSGILFTIVGNLCPLTRITPKKIVHLKETISNSVETPKPEIKVYSRRPKQIKSVGYYKKAKIVESKIANNSKPNHLWGSNATYVPSSSSLVNDRPRQLLPYVSPKTDLLYDNAMEKLLMSSYMIENPIDPTFIYAPKKKAYRICNRRTQKIIETIHVDFDELTAMASEQLGSGPELKSMTPATSSSGLVPNPIPQQPCIPPPRDDWDRLFQPMFDEYFNPLTIVVSPVPVADAPRAVDLADSPVSTSIDEDAPSSSIPSTQDQVHSLIISQGFEESPKTPHFHDDPLHEFLHEDSTSPGSSSNMRPIHTPFE
ncbi:hypothetical protein Tco_0861843, partial [Tanacetum coccineum]